MTTDQDSRLTRIEQRLTHIEQLLESFQRAVLPVIENPGRLLAKIMGGK